MRTTPSIRHPVSWVIISGVIHPLLPVFTACIEGKFDYMQQRNAILIILKLLSNTFVPVQLLAYAVESDKVLKGA